MSRPCVNVCSSSQGNPSSLPPQTKAQPCVGLEFSFPPSLRPSTANHSPLSPPHNLRQ
ncbi:hypothetical protein LY78DRAFT_656479 [Colletotrichum sublineola]|nr:hypothetical protein LY78DRAFT_656479 [Colletotrichum sublineola]